jgi:Ca2+ transporting ATPase
MSIILNVGGKHRILVKGASEMVLRSCTNFHNKISGLIEPLDESLKEEMQKSIKNMADKALRTIVLAYKDLKGGEDLTTKDRLGVFDVETKNLNLMAIFGV